MDLLLLFRNLPCVCAMSNIVQIRTSAVESVEMCNVVLHYLQVIISIGEIKQMRPADHCTHSLSGVEVAGQCELLDESFSPSHFSPSVSFCLQKPPPFPKHHLSSQLLICILKDERQRLISNQACQTDY